MTAGRFKALMNMDMGVDDIKIEKVSDGLAQGMQIIKTTLPYEDQYVSGAIHDMMVTVHVSKLAKACISEKDVLKLKSLGWVLRHDGYLGYIVQEKPYVQTEE